MKVCKTEGCDAVRTHVKEWGGRATCGDCKAKAVREAAARKKATKHTFESWKAMRKKDYPRVEGWGKRAPTADMFVSEEEHAQTVAFWRRETLLTCEQWLESLTNQGWGSDPRKRKDFFNQEEQSKAFQIWRQNYQKDPSFVRSAQNQARRSPDNSFKTYVNTFRPPRFDDILTHEVVVDTDTVFELKVTECLSQDYFHWANASDIGYAWICFGDYAWAEGFNPEIKLIRDKTLMQGHDYCNHRYVWKG